MTEKVQLSKTGLVAEVDLTDRDSGAKIGVGHIERTKSGYVIIHVNGEDIPGCVEKGFGIGAVWIAEDRDG